MNRLPSDISRHLEEFSRELEKIEGTNPRKSTYILQKILEVAIAEKRQQLGQNPAETEELDIYIANNRATMWMISMRNFRDDEFTLNHAEIMSCVAHRLVINILTMEESEWEQFDRKFEKKFSGLARD